MDTKHTRLFVLFVGVTIAVGLTGCAKPVDDSFVMTPIKKAKPFAPGVDSGVPLAFDKKDIFVEAAAKPFLARMDPFALNGPQLSFERSQEKERLLQNLGGFYPAVAPPEVEDVPPVLEPQPYRRLAGVVVGQSVIGIIELNGNDQQLIRPGQLIPGTNWRVVSIDTDKAVLRRGGNVLPHEIVVRLESRPFGSGGGNGSGTPGTSGGSAFPGTGPTGPPGRGGPGGGSGTGSD